MTAAQGKPDYGTMPIRTSIESNTKKTTITMQDLSSTSSHHQHPYDRRRSSLHVYRTFLDDFMASNGGWLLIVLGFLTSLGIGGLVGVVPQVATQKFAEEHFGLEEGIQCNTYDATTDVVPEACVQGADYAQGAASYSAMARNLLALLLNSVAGSYSDRHGRRGVQIVCLLLITLSPISFWLIQICDRVPPIFYYILESFSGVISWFSIAFTQLSDVMPPKHRAASYGLYFGSFMAGIAIAPYMATLMSHTQIALVSAVIRIVALLLAIFCMPETLPVEHRRRQSIAAVEVAPDDYYRADNPQSSNRSNAMLKILLSPLEKMTILQRSSSLLLVAFGAFTSKMVFSADVTLFFYYIEANLGVTDQDVALMMFVTGVVGVLVQAGLLKYLISWLGERKLLVVSFGSGMVHNLIYGFADNKWYLYSGLCLSALTNTNNALLSSVASRSVAKTEQGHVQGALFSLTSLAEAIGPVSFNFIYRNWHSFGPGTMFVVGAFLYALGMVAVSFVPPKSTTTTGLDDDDDDDDDQDVPSDNEAERRRISELGGSRQEKEGLVLV